MFFGTNLASRGRRDALQPWKAENGIENGAPEEAFAAFIAAHTAEEAEDILANGGVPCSRLMDYEAARNHPHYQARGVIAEWLACDDESVIPGVKVVPDLANHPGRVWRGAPATGQDNEDVLGELGIDEVTIAAMYDKQLLGKPPPYYPHGV